VEERLQEIAEGDVPDLGRRQDLLLSDLRMIDEAGLVEFGNDFYMARFVVQDSDATASALMKILTHQPTIHALLEALWPVGSVQTSGAVSMLKRLTRSQDERAAKRTLELLNQAKLVAYNRNSAKMRVLFNPSELTVPDQEKSREQDRAHVISRETPFGNLLALRDLLRAARGTIRWWEQHMPAKVLEVLYRELDGESVTNVRLLSGPANLTDDLKSDFKRFRTEMKQKRGIEVEWRVLARREAFEHHDRFFITDGLSRNLPPLNTILAGSTGEILPSDLTEDEFDQWWNDGADLMSFSVDAAAS
jgi:hypothetical protein